MFEHQMLEGKSNRVKIDDVDPDVMTEVLRFIYTGRINNIEKMSDLLLPVADKVNKNFNLRKLYFKKMDFKKLFCLKSKSML